MTALRVLTPTSVEIIKQGEGTNGPWTLWGVQADDENGQGITDTLKTFHALEVGEPVECEIERQQHDTYGVSYMLKPTNKGGLAASVDRLRRRVAVLEAKVEWMASQLPLEAGRPPELDPDSSGLESEDDPPDVLTPAPSLDEPAAGDAEIKF